MATCPTCRTQFDDGVELCPDDGVVLLPDAAFTNVDDALGPGDMVDDYKVDAQIGAGTYGTVYRAEHKVIGKRAALKVLNRRFSSDPHIVSRFIAEARAVNKVGHPNIVDIFAFGALHDGRQYLAMELLEGESLGERLTRDGPLAIQDALPILREVADALDAAHEAGIAHRDLKPDNIFLARVRGGRVTAKLLDFGVAKLQGESVQHKTATGMTIGTPLYMSPEQVRSKKVTTKADIYAFGCVIFEVLTGNPPFVDETVVDVMMHHVNTPPPAVSLVRPGVPEELDAPLRALLAKAPKARPASATVAVDELEAAYKQSLIPKSAKDTASTGTPRGLTGGDAHPFATTQHLTDEDYAGIEIPEPAPPRVEVDPAFSRSPDLANTSALPSELQVSGLEAPPPTERFPETSPTETDPEEASSKKEAVGRPGTLDATATAVPMVGPKGRGVQWAVALATVAFAAVGIAFLTMDGEAPSPAEIAPAAEAPPGAASEGDGTSSGADPAEAASSDADPAEAAEDGSVEEGAQEEGSGDDPEGDPAAAPFGDAAASTEAAPPAPVPVPVAPPPVRTVAKPAPPPPPPPPPDGGSPLFTERD